MNILIAISGEDIFYAYICKNLIFMRLIIHDLGKDKEEILSPILSEDTQIIANNGKIKPCIGCFGCWTKMPGECVIKNDGYNHIGKMFGHASEIWVISECVYGSFSPFVKNVFDRSIGYLLPFFKIVNGEMHHRMRYDNKFTMKTYFYGDHISEDEKQTARGILAGNFINMGCSSDDILFFDSLEALKGGLR